MPLQPSTPVMMVAGTPLVRFASRLTPAAVVTAAGPAVAVPAKPIAAALSPAAAVQPVAALQPKIVVNPNTVLAQSAAKPIFLQATALRTGIQFVDFVRFLPNVDRSHLTVPVAPSAQVGTGTLFEDPKDASKKYFVMGYKVDEETTTHGRQFAVRMLANPQGWTLTVTLAKAAPDATVRANPGAQELPHQLSLVLRYKQRVNGVPSAVSEMAFTETSIDGDKVQGKLAIDSLGKTRELHEALTHAELNCEIVVQTHARVGIPVPQTSPPAPAPHPVFPRPPVFIPGRPVVRPMATPLMAREMTFERIPEHAIESVQNKPVPPPQLYRETDVMIAASLPFTFDDALDGYIFEGLGSATGGSSQGLVRKQIVWNGETHVYYQEDGTRNLFYYLPDTFKIARHPAAPHQPLMSVRFDSPDGSKEKMQASFSYCALPVINHDRLTSALAEMKAMVPADILQAAGGIELEPLLPDPDKVQLKLAYPGGAGQGGPFAVRPQAQVHFIHGIVDALSLSLDEFRALYNAMFSTGQLLFTGVVEFEMGGTGEQVSFQLRMSDTAEPFGSWTQAADGDDIVVTFVNEVESPLHIRTLDAIVTKDNNLLVKPLAAESAAYPVEIAPAASAAFRLAAAGGATLADLDLSDVQTAPDPETVLNLILDPSTLPAYLRPLKVKTFAPVFAAPAGHPENQVMSVVVDFEGGATVELTADHLEVDGAIPVPVVGFIAGKSESQQYRYKITVARLSGVTADTDWRTGDSGILFPVVH